MDISLFPTVNASLNGLTTILLFLGFVFIKRGMTNAHKACMVSALGSSAVFLACYLYYHFMKGEPTRYPLQDWSRTVYFVILISHTILAVVILPFIFAAVYQAFRKNFEKHKRIVRWVWPVWMYVSFTGVVIYWMLYHFAGATR